MSPDSKALLISILSEATEGRQRRTPVSSNGFELSRVGNAIMVVQRSDAFETGDAVELMATVTTDLVELETVPLSHSPSYSVELTRTAELVNASVLVSSAASTVTSPSRVRAKVLR